MFSLLVWKELKAFFTNKANLAFLFLLPVLLISIFGGALGNYVKADYETFAGGRVLVYEDSPDEERLLQFTEISDEVTRATGVVFERTDDEQHARSEVEASEAFGVVRVSAEGFDWWRSPFNEPEGAKIARTLFVQLSQSLDAQGHAESSTSVEEVVIEGKPLDSSAYYTFAGLAFSILFTGLLVAFSVRDEKDFGTIERIRISKAGIAGMVVGKTLAGLLGGLVQIAVAYLLSTIVFGVDWGAYAPIMVGLAALLALYSSAFGAAVGLLAKSKSMCQSVVLMVSLLCGYLGGSITPLYLLENVPVMDLLVKVSPLYWMNQAMNALYNGIVDERVFYAAAVLTALTIVVLVLCMVASRAAGASAAAAVGRKATSEGAAA